MILNETVSIFKFTQDKRDLAYVNKIETPASRKTSFVKVKESHPSLEATTDTTPYCIICNKPKTHSK